jgi:hypothetical protein
VVTKVNADDSISVAFDDGDEEDNVLPSDYRVGKEERMDFVTVDSGSESESESESDSESDSDSESVFKPAPVQKKRARKTRQPAKKSQNPPSKSKGRSPTKSGLKYWTDDSDSDSSSSDEKVGGKAAAERKSASKAKPMKKQQPSAAVTKPASKPAFKPATKRATKMPVSSKIKNDVFSGDSESSFSPPPKKAKPIQSSSKPVPKPVPKSVAKNVAKNAEKNVDKKKNHPKVSASAPMASALASKSHAPAAKKPNPAAPKATAPAAPEAAAPAAPKATAPTAPIVSVPAAPKASAPAAKAKRAAAKLAAPAKPPPSSAFPGLSAEVIVTIPPSLLRRAPGSKLGIGLVAGEYTATTGVVIGGLAVRGGISPGSLLAVALESDGVDYSTWASDHHRLIMFVNGQDLNYDAAKDTNLEILKKHFGEIEKLGAKMKIAFSGPIDQERWRRKNPKKSGDGGSESTGRTSSLPPVKLIAVPERKPSSIAPTPSPRDPDLPPKTDSADVVHPRRKIAQPVVPPKRHHEMPFRKSEGPIGISVVDGTYSDCGTVKKGLFVKEVKEDGQAIMLNPPEKNLNAFIPFRTRVTGYSVDNGIMKTEGFSCDTIVRKWKECKEVVLLRFETGSVKEKMVKEPKPVVAGASSSSGGGGVAISDAAAVPRPVSATLPSPSGNPSNAKTRSVPSVLSQPRKSVSKLANPNNIDKRDVVFRPISAAPSSSEARRASATTMATPDVMDAGNSWSAGYRNTGSGNTGASLFRPTPSDPQPALAAGKQRAPSPARPSMHYRGISPPSPPKHHHRLVASFFNDVRGLATARQGLSPNHLLDQIGGFPREHFQSGRHALEAAEQEGFCICSTDQVGDVTIWPPRVSRSRSPPPANNGGLQHGLDETGRGSIFRVAPRAGSPQPPCSPSFSSPYSLGEHSLPYSPPYSPQQHSPRKTQQYVQSQPQQQHGTRLSGHGAMVYRPVADEHSQQKQLQQQHDTRLSGPGAMVYRPVAVQHAQQQQQHQHDTLLSGPGVMVYRPAAAEHALFQTDLARANAVVATEAAPPMIFRGGQQLAPAPVPTEPEQPTKQTLSSSPVGDGASTSEPKKRAVKFKESDLCVVLTTIDRDEKLDKKMGNDAFNIRKTNMERMAVNLASHEFQFFFPKRFCKNVAEGPHKCPANNANNPRFTLCKNCFYCHSCCTGNEGKFSRICSKTPAGEVSPSQGLFSADADRLLEKPMEAAIKLAFGFNVHDSNNPCLKISGCPGEVLMTDEDDEKQANDDAM